MKKQLELIHNGLNKAIISNIKITAHPFTIFEKEKIIAVNWAGSVVFNSNDLSYKNLKSILDIDDLWFYNFNIGWSQGRCLTVENKNGILSNEEISYEALKLSKQYLHWR
jgi:hypothetical protein